MMSAETLSKKWRQFLLNRQQKPSRETEFVVNKDKLAILLDWCEFNDINLGHEAGNNFIITRVGIYAVEQWLVDNNQPPLATVYRDTDRQQLTAIEDDEKQAAIKPKDLLALMAVTEPTVLSVIQPFYLESGEPLAQINLEIVVSQFDLSPFQRLLVIENRDSFNDWHRYVPYAQLNKPLVIYRGDGGDATACKSLHQRWQREKTHCPMIYFGDFDLAGLSLAIGGGYQQLLLPEIEWLSHALKSAHFTEAEAYRLRGLVHRCPNQWRPLLDLISQRKAGLRQQWMFDTPLTLY